MPSRSGHLGIPSFRTVVFQMARGRGGRGGRGAAAEPQARQQRQRGAGGGGRQPAEDPEAEQQEGNGFGQLAHALRDVVAAVANNPAAKKAARKKKQKLRPASSQIARGQKKRKKDSSSSSSSSDSEPSDEEEVTGEDEPEDGEPGEDLMQRRLNNMEKRLKQSREDAKNKAKLAEEEEKLKGRFQEQLAQVKNDSNKERVTFLQRIFSDCTAVELDIISKKVKLRKDVRKRFTQVFELLMRRIALLLADDRTPGIFAYKTIIETGEAEACYTKSEVDRLKKYEGQIRANVGPGSGRNRAQRQAAPAAPGRQARKDKPARRQVQQQKQQCNYAGCVAAGNTNHARAACWKDPNSRKFRPQQGGRAPAAEPGQ